MQSFLNLGKADRLKSPAIYAHSKENSAQTLVPVDLTVLSQVTAEHSQSFYEISELFDEFRGKIIAVFPEELPEARSVTPTHVLQEITRHLNIVSDDGSLDLSGYYGNDTILTTKKSPKKGHSECPAQGSPRGWPHT